jgi:peptide/nickel transport system substrate-binding protein
VAAANSSSYISSVESYSKVDDYTIQFKTKTPDSYLLYGMSNILYPSPKAVKESGLNFKLKPVGTGPFKFVEMVERDRLVMERNPDYWGGAAKLDRVVLRPMVEPAARLSALMAGEVQWAEVPPVDSVDNLKSKRFQIYTNPYPNSWSYVFNLKEKPFDNVKVRQALNYAIDREGMTKHLLHGAATAATGPMFKGQSWYPEGATVYNFDPAKAKQLLAEAGYPNGFSTKFVIPNGGSGAMWPIQMGEFVQQNLKDIGVNVQFEVIEWNTMRTQYRKGFTVGVGAYNYPWTTLKPDFVEQFYMSTMMTPRGLNPGGYNNPEVDKLFTAARKTFNIAERDKLIAQAIKYVQDEAAWLFVVHDNNLRVLGPKVKGFVQPQSGYADLTKVWIDK